MPAVDKDRDFNRLQNFAYTYCRHVKGAMAGQPVLFEDWLAEDLRLAYEVDKTGKRVFNQVILSYPKKHSKSLTTTICGLYELSPFRHKAGAPENYSLAGTREQARLTLDPARMMLDPQNAAYSPLLAQMFYKQRNTIICPSNAGKWEVLPHNADTVEGINPSFVACDEYALGCLLFQMLSGRPPYEATREGPNGVEIDETELVKLHKMASVPRSSLPIGVPDLVATWVERMLAKRPWRRFEYAG